MINKIDIEYHLSNLQAQVDWDNYSAYHPRYPPSLATLLLDYHRTHSNAFHLAHDLGSGPTIFAQSLAEHFQHVHVSDSRPHFIDKARESLDAWFAENRQKGRFTFSVAPAERADEVAAKASIDLVTLTHFAHCTEQDVVLRKVARSLASGGTLAIVSVCPQPRVVGNERVSVLVQRLFTAWMESTGKKAGGEESKTLSNHNPWDRSGLESVRLHEELYEQNSEERISINRRGHDEAAHIISGSGNLVAAGRESTKDRRNEYSSDDPEGEGWRCDVDGSWFRGLIGTLEKKDRLHLHGEHFQEIERTVKQTAQDNSVTIEWTVDIFFATKK